MSTSELNTDQPLAELQANSGNPRTCTPEELNKLAATLRRHGHVGALVARRTPEGLRVISGHQRLAALRQLGVTTTPCHIVDCTDSEETELLLQLNGHAGDWDDNQLADIIAKIAEDDGAEGLRRLQIHSDQIDAELAKLTAELEKSERELADAEEKTNAAALTLAETGGIQADTAGETEPESPENTEENTEKPAEPQPLEIIIPAKHAEKIAAWLDSWHPGDPVGALLQIQATLSAKESARESGDE